MSENTEAQPAQERPSPFMMLCGSLGAQVHMALGLIADPVEKKPRVEMEAARQGIEMLDVLEAKTKGNLEERERKLLGDILTQLRLLYVEVHKRERAETADADAAESESETETATETEGGD